MEMAPPRDKALFENPEVVLHIQNTQDEFKIFTSLPLLMEVEPVNLLEFPIL